MMNFSDKWRESSPDLESASAKKQTAACCTWHDGRPLTLGREKLHPRTRLVAMIPTREVHLELTRGSTQPRASWCSLKLVRYLGLPILPTDLTVTAAVENQKHVSLIGKREIEKMI